MMRKEQHKALQEKQNSNSRNSKVGDVLSLCEGLVDSKEEKELFARNYELEISAVTPAVSNDSEKSSLSSQAPASRPLVPPGFKTNPLEKSSGLKSLIHPSLSEVHNFHFYLYFYFIVYWVECIWLEMLVCFFIYQQQTCINLCHFLILKVLNHTLWQTVFQTVDTISLFVSHTLHIVIFLL